MSRLLNLVFLLGIWGCSFAQDEKLLGTEALNSGRYAEAYQLWLPLAEKGDAEVQEAIALLLTGDMDLGIKLSPVEREKSARSWVVRSAVSGNRSAMRWLGQALQSGWLGLKPDHSSAECWLAASENRFDKTKCTVPTR